MEEVSDGAAPQGMLARTSENGRGCPPKDTTDGLLFASACPSYTLKPPPVQTTLCTWSEAERSRRATRTLVQYCRPVTSDLYSP
eukprot:scaffold900_cov430-Prasinococcus_capsulatus_cf.AAC.1